MCVVCVLGGPNLIYDMDWMLKRVHNVRLHVMGVSVLLLSLLLLLGLAALGGCGDCETKHANTV